jgi:hypothetical protein
MRGQRRAFDVAPSYERLGGYAYICARAAGSAAEALPVRSPQGGVATGNPVMRCALAIAQRLAERVAAKQPADGGT